MPYFTYQLVPNQTHTYGLTIQQSGQAQFLQSNNVPPHSSLGAGTMTVQVGSIQQTITIDSTNDHIEGIAAAIENAGYPHIETSYAILDPDNGYITIRSGSPGTDWLPSISFFLTVDNGLSQLAFNSVVTGEHNETSHIESPNNFWTETISATSTVVTFNNQVYVYDTNTITDLIPGYSLIINQADTASIITVPQIS